MDLHSDPNESPLKNFYVKKKKLSLHDGEPPNAYIEGVKCHNSEIIWFL